MLNRRLWIFLFVFMALNLSFIPLLSLYGLRVCPVLSIPGFAFGCYYSAVYVVAVNLTNLFLILIVISSRRRLLAYATAYFVSTAVALIVLQYLLKINHLSPGSRAPEILIFASLLLGITQAYGLNWALPPRPHEIQEILPDQKFLKYWISHILRTLMPLTVAALILLHFLFRQSTDLNHGQIASLASTDQIIEQTSYLILFLMSWLSITFCFHFLSEKDHVTGIQNHLEHLNNLDFKFRSNLNEAWGLWAALLNQLNLFSKILGERSRLINAFSRFVTTGVAQQALNQELIEGTGTTIETTVIMSDIRDFTKMSEGLLPNQVVTLLNEYFTVMLDVMSMHQITVDKFIGDGILAYLEPETNSTTSAESDNNLAVLAALAMLQRLDSLNKKLTSMSLPPLKIGIGIFRGPLVIGLIGAEAKLQHTIIGDTVNRAARLEGLCKKLGASIVISQSVFDSLKPELKDQFLSQGQQQIPGLQSTIQVFARV